MTGKIAPDVSSVDGLYITGLALRLALAQHVLCNSRFGLGVVAINAVLQVIVFFTQKI